VSRVAESVDLLGEVLDGNYRATRYVGRGAMGTIYEATQLRLNKRVALKVISRDLAGNPVALERFRREAEVTSQLGHPHIVNVFDFGTTPSGEPYMAMEFLEGEDLEARLRRVGQLPLGAVTLIVRQVASALAATHAGGIVHRDLKPANIFLVRMEGEPEFTKVVDFGISKVHAAAHRITKGMVALGTPQFMSPEQAAGRIDEIDHRTDQWALACIAYEALTGRSPFVAEDPIALVYQVMHEDPPSIVSLVPNLPKELDPVFRRALSKEATERFENITAFARAFEAAAGLGSGGLRMSPGNATGLSVELDDRTVFDNRPPSLEEPAPASLKPVSLLAAALAIGLAVASIWFVRGRPKRPPPPPPPVAAVETPAKPPPADSPPARPRPRPSDSARGATTRSSQMRAPGPAPSAADPGRPKRSRPRPKSRLIEEL
jgi:serine/threonine-protein kinase